MSFSLQGLNNYLSSDVTSEYWLNRIYPPEIRRAHKGGDIHIHDLSLLSVYCVGWDLNDLLRQGFKGVEGKVESAPPKHLRSALGQVVNFFYTLQGKQQAHRLFQTLTPCWRLLCALTTWNIRGSSRRSRNLFLISIFPPALVFRPLLRILPLTSACPLS